LVRKIAFDGNLKWICPHCGAENEGIDADITAYGSFRSAWFAVVGDKVEIDENEEPNYDYFEYNLFCCPKCRGDVTAKEIKDGLFKWLEKIRKENPELYSEVMADLVEP
jgi:predicted nucleic-acid-binding Zn-ribbon protein